MRKVSIKVKGMHCKSCEELINDSLNEFEEIKRVQSDFKSGVVNVEFDEEEFSEDQIKTLIKNEGYQVK